MLCTGLVLALACCRSEGSETTAGARAGPVVAPCPQEGMDAEVECGHIRVFENRQSSEGRQIELHFVRARASGADPAPDPIFILVGGPGQHASPTAATQLRAKSRYLERRDIVLVDQRGTGRSHSLDCEEYDLEADPSGFARLFEVDFFALWALLILMGAWLQIKGGRRDL